MLDTAKQGRKDHWGSREAKKGDRALTDLPSPLLYPPGLSHTHHSFLAVVLNPVWQEDSCVCWDLGKWGREDHQANRILGLPGEEALRGSPLCLCSSLVSSAFPHLGGLRQE